MQEETTEKTISLCIKGTKVTGTVLKAALRKVLDEMNKQKISVQQHKSHQVTRRGKQSLKQMMKEGSQLTNIEITDQNIKSFERVARKYGIDYSLKKDNATTPPRYLVFFRARDADVMTAAFREYANMPVFRQKRTKSQESPSAKSSRSPKTAWPSIGNAKKSRRKRGDKSDEQENQQGRNAGSQAA